MNTLRTLLTWLGRLLLLGIVYILVAGFVFTAGLEPLSPVLCPSGLRVETDRDQLAAIRESHRSYEQVCDSEDRLELTTDRWMMVMGGMAAGATVVYLVRNKLTPRQLSAPVLPAGH